jgi:hypothetical protein
MAVYYRILNPTFVVLDDMHNMFSYFSEWDLVHKSRTQDIQLLKALRVKYIFDLMLENKKVKYGMRCVVFLFNF